jgi:hypothetical protein
VSGKVGKSKKGDNNYGAEPDRMRTTICEINQREKMKRNEGMKKVEKARTKKNFYITKIVSLQ